MPTSILSRKRDLIYLIFFAIHIPIVFLVDTYPLWPPSLIPQFMTILRNFYITTYADQFFISPPAWFSFYIWMELLYHVPLSLWAIRGLWRDDARVPIQLLGYAVQTGVTTGTCIAEMLGWEVVSGEQKWKLAGLYGPYLGVSVFMGVDMYLRLSREVMGRRRRVEGVKKRS